MSNPDSTRKPALASGPFDSDIRKRGCRKGMRMSELKGPLDGYFSMFDGSQVASSGQVQIMIMTTSISIQ